MDKLMISKKIHVGYVVNYFIPAGLQNFVLTLINNLDRSKFFPHLYIFFKSDETFCSRLKKDVPIVFVNRKSGRDFRSLFWTARKMRTDGIHVFQVHNWGTFVEGAIIKMIYPGLKLLHVQQGMEYDQTLLASKFKNLIRKTIRKSLIGYFDQLVGCSGEAKRYLEQEWGAKNVQLIYNSVDTEQFNGKATPDPKIEEFNGFSICTVGRIAPVKNYLCLFKAINLLKEKIPEVKLFHIGTNPTIGPLCDEELLFFMKKNNLEKHISFLGIRSDLPSLLPTFDVFSLTSFSEGLSFSLLEAQASGLPAVVTNVGGNPEVIQDGKNGFLVPSNNEKAVAEAIYNLYKDLELRKKMGIYARKLMQEKFDIKVMVSEYEKLYTKIL